MQKIFCGKNLTVVCTVIRRRAAESLGLKKKAKPLTSGNSTAKLKRRKDCQYKTWRLKFFLKNPLAKSLSAKILHKAHTAKRQRTKKKKNMQKMSEY